MSSRPRPARPNPPAPGKARTPRRPDRSSLRRTVDGPVIDLDRYVPGLMTMVNSALTRGASSAYLSLYAVGIETWRCLVLLAIEGRIRLGRTVHHRHHAVDDVVDVGEVAPELTVIEDLDGATRQDGLGKAFHAAEEPQAGADFQQDGVWRVQAYGGGKAIRPGGDFLEGSKLLGRAALDQPELGG